MLVVVPVLGYVYFQDQSHEVPLGYANAIKASLFVGMIVGQLLFGVLGDMFGRLRVYGYQMLITAFGTIMIILLPPYLPRIAAVGWICVFRFISGLGIGGGMPFLHSFYELSYR